MRPILQEKEMKEDVVEITDDHHRLVGYTLRPLLPLCSRHCVGWGAEVWVGVDDLVLDWKN